MADNRKITTASTAQADLSKHVAALALKPGWRQEDHHGIDPEAIALALSRFDRMMTPAKERENLGEEHGQLEDALAMILIKIDPRISADQSDAWTKTMRFALSDLPIRVALEATRDALHRPLQFVNQADAAIRDAAGLIDARYRIAWRRLAELHDALKAAHKPKIEAPVDNPPPMSLDECRETASGFYGERVLFTGIASGRVTQADYDTVMAERHPQAQ